MCHHPLPSAGSPGAQGRREAASPEHSGVRASSPLPALLHLPHPSRSSAPESHQAQSLVGLEVTHRPGEVPPAAVTCQSCATSSTVPARPAPAPQVIPVIIPTETFPAELLVSHKCDGRWAGGSASTCFPSRQVLREKHSSGSSQTLCPWTPLFLVGFASQGQQGQQCQGVFPFIHGL